MKHQLQIKWQNAFIDPAILELVKSLNNDDLNIHTIACCQGHYKFMSHPYVYFTCPVEIAAEIERNLGVIQSGGKLNFNWSVTGRFNQDNQLCFSIESDQLKQAKHSLLKTFYYYILKRKYIDDNLAALTEIIKDIQKEYKK